MKITIKVIGDKEVVQAIKKLEAKNNAGLLEAVKKSAIYVENAAKQTTAWKNVTGNLRSRITHVIETQKNKHRGKVGTNVFYGPYLEFGTSRVKAHPWLIPALKNSRKAILNFIEKAIKAIK